MDSRYKVSLFRLGTGNGGDPVIKVYNGCTEVYIDAPYIRFKIDEKTVESTLPFIVEQV